MSEYIVIVDDMVVFRSASLAAAGGFAGGFGPGAVLCEALKTEHDEHEAENVQSQESAAEQA